MKRFALASMVTGVCLAAWLGSGGLSVGAQEKARPSGYLGAESCKACHSRPAKGEQYMQWRHSPHARAFETLKTEAARAVAVRLGLNESPDAAPACLRCHVTGYGVDPELLGRKYSAVEGVSCETCHGPAEAWKVLHMTDPAGARSRGMTVVTRDVCVQCHNSESPTFADFDFERARAVIAHPNPQRERTQE